MLQRIFVDGFGDFNALVRAASRPRRVAAHFIRLFVRHPSLAWLSDAFFRFAYNPLSALREN